MLGSVAFLHSGATLRPILAKSQCWCVDGESKFVLRIVQDNYYRIELPNTLPDEKKKVEEFKKVLAKILQYEVTPCPFKRGFTVDLPDPPQTPIQKRPWRPKQRVQPVLDQKPEKSDSIERVSLRRLKAESSKATGNADLSLAPKSETETARDDWDVDLEVNGADTTDHEDDTVAANASDLDTDNPAEHDFDGLGTLKTPTRPRTLRTGRAITAPPQLTLQTTPPSSNALSISNPHELKTKPSSLSSSEDSFHSFHSPISPLPPSPPYSDPPSPTPRSEDILDLHIPRQRSHTRDTSELTITDGSKLWDLTKADPRQEDASPSSPILPRTPPLVSDTASEDHWSEPVTPQPPTELRRRGKRLTRRSFSPLPSPVNLYSPRNRLSGHHLTTAILQKTCSMLLGPPVQLVALMLNIAAKIANGVHRGALFGYGEVGQKIPCSWDFSDAEPDDESDDVWEEDDYGVSLGHLPSSKAMAAKETGGSWEID